jgi:hypothetical protein
MTPRMGEYQARLDNDYVIGYYKTKEEAIKVACAEATKAAAQGHQQGSAWYVGEVVHVGTYVEDTQHQTSDGTGRSEWGTDVYLVVNTSTVAFGKATYTYNRNPRASLQRVAQGSGRAT